MFLLFFFFGAAENLTGDASKNKIQMISILFVTLDFFPFVLLTATLSPSNHETKIFSRTSFG